MARLRFAAASGVVAVAAAGCHGPTIVEEQPDGGAGAGGGGRGGAGGGMAGATGGSAAGRGGGGGRGGSAGGANAGAGGACAARLSPAMFYESLYAPNVADATSDRYYWVQESPTATIHYASSVLPETDHPLQFAPGTRPWNVAVGDSRVAAMWWSGTSTTTISVFGADDSSSEIGTTTLANGSAIAIDGADVYYKFEPPTGDTRTPGIYRWTPPDAPALFASYTRIGLQHTDVHILRLTPSYLVIAGAYDVWVVDRATQGLAQLRFQSASAVIVDVLPALPRTLDGGVLVRVDDGSFNATGRDFYFDVGAATTGKDLAMAVNALAAPPGCTNERDYEGGGVLYQNHYVYEGRDGLFVVDVATGGAVSNPARLTAIKLRYPRVTNAGAVFAAWAETVSRTFYYRVGAL